MHYLFFLIDDYLCYVVRTYLSNVIIENIKHLKYITDVSEDNEYKSFR